MKFSPGDRVRFIDDVGEATIVRIKDSEHVIIEDDDGFEYEHLASDLMIVSDRAAEREAYGSVEPEMTDIIHRNIDSKVVEAAADDFEVKYKNNRATNQYRRGEMIEVDLHIHELVESESGLSNADMLEIQMQHFDRMLRRAESERIGKIIFIHGVGQGVLRDAIRKTLESYYPNASFHDADHRVYGYGATEVRITFGG
jgi:DNA-nicking Smr family endonuclease